MSAALGIDLGTTNSVAAIATPTGVEFILGARGERVHPSVVAFPASGGVVAGTDAKRYRLSDTTHVIHSAKRFIGQNIRAPMVQLALTGVRYRVLEGPNQQPIVQVRDRQLTMPEVSSHVLMHLRRAAERQLATQVTGAVITVPANFTDAQRQATKEAGRLAGLEVMRLINEPTAAALAYGFGKDTDQVIAVYDFGGGTFDVSILRLDGELFEVLASEGDFFLGGDDLDRVLADRLADDCQGVLGVDPRPHPGLMMKLMMAAEAIKIHLSDHDAAEGEIEGLDLPISSAISSAINSTTGSAAGSATGSPGGSAGKLPFALTRKQFDAMIAGHVQRTIDVTRLVLAAANLEPGAVTDVLCVGGSTRIPLVRRRLAELFGREPNISINPDEVVAQGAAIQAGSLTGNLSSGTGMGARDAVATAGHSPLARGAAMLPGAAVKRPVLMDVNPATLGIHTAGGFIERVLEKNAPIPIERTRVFTTSRDNQTRVEIDCCRGEKRRYTENEPLGTLLLDGLAPRPRGDLQIEVRFRVDADGILHVRASDPSSGQIQEAHLQVLGAPVAKP
ncbi:MAG TPA: Hsp70 family protein [Kofleriaceae bacterium]|nr:Hsp70 family protein [Kofleriaceae bacterium]